MSNDRYVPRSYSLDPLNFGSLAKIRWIAADDLSDSELDQRNASVRQHDACVRMRETISIRHGSVIEYCSFIAAKPARMGRMLRGEVIMRLEDIANAERHLGMTL